MSTDPLPAIPRSLRKPILHELAELRGNWFWFLALGILTIVLGTALLGMPLLGTLTAIWMLSALLIAGGVLQFVGAFWVREWSGFAVALLAGVLYVALGVLTIDRPLSAAAALTILIAAFLIIGGLFRIILALSYRFDGWGWPLLNGVINVVLGLMIWRQFPDSALWVIGLFLGIDMIFHGWTWVMIALMLRKLPRRDRVA
jgi:uncharacterized membrane protein HdeD (DUF308 family)